MFWPFYVHLSPLFLGNTISFVFESFLESPSDIITGREGITLKIRVPVLTPKLIVSLFKYLLLDSKINHSEQTLVWQVNAIETMKSKNILHKNEVKNKEKNTE